MCAFSKERRQTMKTKTNLRLVAFVFVLGLVRFLSPVWAQHPTDCEEGPLQSILSVGDFDGDGVVSRSDIKLISHQSGSGEYIAFFDLNADGVINGGDVSQTARAMGEGSTLLDRQLAELYWATEKYRDMGNAIAAGYRPFTQTLHGHGIHLAKLPFLATPSGLDPDYENVLDGHLNIAEPEGLNYDENGNLVAVFYFHGIDVRQWVFANSADEEAVVEVLFQKSVEIAVQSAVSGGVYPQLFDSDEALWHQHWGACWDGLDYIDMAFDPTIIPIFNQHMFPQECAAQGESSDRRQGWIPAFNMIHVWLYRMNPCGLFAGTHPHVSEGYPEEPTARPLAEWFHGMGLPNPYSNGGHH
jgi:hypothetical protein